MSDEKFKEFRAKKSTIKRRFTGMEKFIESASKEDTSEYDIKNRLEALQSLEKECSVLFENWTEFVIDDEEKLEEFEEEANSIEHRYFNLKTRLMKFLNGLKRENYQSSENKDCSDGSSEFVQKLTKTNQRKNPRVKLPDIQLPKFDGSLEKWITFRDIFHAMIIENDSIPPVQKFVYLNSCLMGDAKKLVDKIPLSATGFDLSWQALQDRYDQRKLIIFKHISQLFASKLVAKDSLEDLRCLIDDSRLHYRALQNMGLPVNSWDMILVYFIVQRLDEETRKLWENESKDNDDVKLDEVIEFLNGRCVVLQSIGDVPLKNKVVPKNTNWKSNSKTFLSSSSPKSEIYRCRLCSSTDKHLFSGCKKFLSFTPKDRFEKIKEFGLCLKCFGGSHTVSKCSRHPCKVCHQNHHELLHFVSEKSASEVSSENRHKKPEPSLDGDNFVSMSCKNNSSNQVILPTAIILIADCHGNFQECRALLDSASQSNLMSKQLATRLQLDGDETCNTVYGLNNLAITIRKRVKSTVKSRIKEFGKQLQFLVVPQISSCLPNHPFDISQWNLLKTLSLADCSFNVSSEVDVILGAGIFFEILKPKNYPSSSGSLRFQDTEFGFVASGFLEPRNPSHCFFLSNVIFNEENLDQQVRSFWEIESCEKKKVMSVEEKECEEIFEKSFRRNGIGRFVVTLPFKDSYRQLGDSRAQALKRFGYLETKLSKNPELKSSYCEFLREYESLGHMSLCQVSHPSNEEYFLPHHAVLRPDSTTTKLRVVFDGSASSSSGLSLNDVLLVGPPQQDELFDLVLRFRRYPVVYIADIEKMYRQILVSSGQVQYQKIVWREDTSQPLRDYQLETVTYGTSAAPYLATKVLQQLAKDVESTLPLAAKAISQDFYMDDLLSGNDTIEEAIDTISQINIALDGAGMNLRKWSSNSSLVLNKINSGHKASNADSQKVIKTLGLRWEPESDTFSFEVKKMDEVQLVTKRTVLSDVAKLFDPIGLLAPVVITAKVFIQSLWLQKLEWDE